MCSDCSAKVLFSEPTPSTQPPKSSALVSRGYLVRVLGLGGGGHGGRGVQVQRRGEARRREAFEDQGEGAPAAGLLRAALFAQLEAPDLVHRLVARVHAADHHETAVEEVRSVQATASGVLGGLRGDLRAGLGVEVEDVEEPVLGFESVLLVGFEDAAEDQRTVRPVALGQAALVEARGFGDCGLELDGPVLPALRSGLLRRQRQGPEVRELLVAHAAEERQVQAAPVAPQRDREQVRVFAGRGPEQHFGVELEARAVLAGGLPEERFFFLELVLVQVEAVLCFVCLPQLYVFGVVGHLVFGEGEDRDASLEDRLEFGVGEQLLDGRQPQRPAQLGVGQLAGSAAATC